MIRFRKHLCIFLLSVLTIASLSFSVRAEAAGKVKHHPFSPTLTASVKKKAFRVKTGKTTCKLTTKGYSTSGYVSFKVPKSKKYKITFSRLTYPKNGYGNNGFAYICRPVDSYGSIHLDQLTFSTTGGKTQTAYFGSASFADGKSTANSYLASRTCSLKLKKGETIYMYLYFSNPGSVQLNIR